RVDMAVVAARELDHAVAASHGPGKPQRAHRRLRARADEPHHLDRRHGVDDLAGELDLRLGGRAEGRPAVGGGVDGCKGLRVRVTEEQRSPRLHPVDVAVALDVLHPASRAARDEHGFVDAHGAHRTDRRVDAAGDQARRPAPAVRPLPQSHPARSFAQYVTIVPAPARLTAVSASRAAARSSRCPASAAARTIAYSPETWYAHTGQSKRSRTARITSRYGSAGFTIRMSAPSSRSSAHSRRASRPFAGSIW